MTPFFLASLILFLLWLGFLLFSGETRREQLVMSVIGLIVAPGALMISAHDYRGVDSSVTAAGIEDLLFSFALFGIAAVIYHILLGKRLEARKGTRTNIQSRGIAWTSQLVIMIGIWLFAILFLSGLYGIAPVHAAIVGGLFIGIYVIADRKDLFADALLSALFMAVLVFSIEQIFFVRLYPEASLLFWNPAMVSGTTLAGIPIEEIHWAAVVGFAVGPVYEYVRRIRFV